MSESATPRDTDLRRRAEEIAREDARRSPESREAPSPEATRQALYELRVHQIELEIQNEELRRAQVELDAARARYFDLYDLAPVSYVTVSETGLILQANLTAATLLGVARAGWASQPIFSRSIVKEDQNIYYRHRKQLLETGTPQAWELRMLRHDGTTFWAHLEATIARDEGGAPVCRIMLSDVSVMRETQEALLEALNNVHTLRGIVPICANCKKIRDDQGYWNQVEAYVQDHTEAEFSHGLCPECAQLLYAEFAEDEGSGPEDKGRPQ
jgi:PAS domain S-box-containing protein